MSLRGQKEDSLSLINIKNICKALFVMSAVVLVVYFSRSYFYIGIGKEIVLPKKPVLPKTLEDCTVSIKDGTDVAMHYCPPIIVNQSSENCQLSCVNDLKTLENRISDNNIIKDFSFALYEGLCGGACKALHNKASLNHCGFLSKSVEVVGKEGYKLEGVSVFIDRA